GLAGAVTGAAEDAGEYVGFPVDHVGVVVTTLGDQTDVFGNRGVRWAGVLAINNFVEIFRSLDVRRLQKNSPYRTPFFTEKAAADHNAMVPRFIPKMASKVNQTLALRAGFWPFRDGFHPAEQDRARPAPEPSAWRRVFGVEGRAAKAAEIRIALMAAPTTTRTGGPGEVAGIPLPIGFVHHLDGDDAGGNGDDGVAGEHRQGGDELPEDRGRGDVAITDGGDGDDGPVDTLGDAGKAVLRPLHHEHQAAEHGGKHQHPEKEHRDLAPRRVQGAKQKPRLGAVAHQLEDAEDAQ